MAKISGQSTPCKPKRYAPRKRETIDPTYEFGSYSIRTIRVPSGGSITLTVGTEPRWIPVDRGNADQCLA